MINVRDCYASAGLADADDLAVKTQAAVAVAVAIFDRGMTQAEYGRLIGWRQPAVSALVRGELDLFSWNRINEALAPLGKAVITRRELVDLPSKPVET